MTVRSVPAMGPTIFVLLCLGLTAANASAQAETKTKCRPDGFGGVKCESVTTPIIDERQKARELTAIRQRQEARDAVAEAQLQAIRSAANEASFREILDIQ
jgi:hypothetical protein